MPLLLPVVLCGLGIWVSLLPPADVAPVERDGERSGSWIAMALATALVLGVCVVAVHRLAQTDVSPHAVATRAAR